MEKVDNLASAQLDSCSQRPAFSAVPPCLPTNTTVSQAAATFAWVTRCSSGVMNSKKGMLIRESEIIGFVGPAQLFLSPVLFPVGIKVTSFLLACFKVAKSKSLFFICLQTRYIFQGWGGGNGFLYQRERENLKRDLNTHCLKTEKVTARASFRGMSC